MSIVIDSLRKIVIRQITQPKPRGPEVVLINNNVIVRLIPLPKEKKNVRTTQRVHLIGSRP